MNYDNDYIAEKLRKWEKYITTFSLPKWEQIPDFGLYMEQVLALLKDYIDYLPPELKEEQSFTSTAVNNYVRNKMIPEPVKKKYYRIHIAYLIMIYTLKQSMSLSLIQKIIPLGISEDEVRTLYVSYASHYRKAANYYVETVRDLSGNILKHDGASEYAVNDTSDLIIMSTVFSGLSRLLAEKLLLLDDKNE